MDFFVGNSRDLKKDFAKEIIQSLTESAEKFFKYSKTFFRSVFDQ